MSPSAIQIDPQPSLDTLPPELIWKIFDILLPKDATSLRATASKFRGFVGKVETLMKDEATDEARFYQLYACFVCMKMLENWCFSDSEMTKDKVRSGPEMIRRSCIPCNIKLRQLRGKLVYVQKKPLATCDRCLAVGRCCNEWPTIEITCQQFHETENHIVQISSDAFRCASQVCLERSQSIQSKAELLQLLKSIAFSRWKKPAEISN